MMISFLVSKYKRRAIKTMSDLLWKFELVAGTFSKTYFLRAVVEQVFGSFMAVIALRIASSNGPPLNNGLSPVFLSCNRRCKQ